MGPSPCTSCAANYRDGAGRLVVRPFASGLAQIHGFFDEFLVTSDADIGLDSVLNCPILVDQERCAPHANAERTIDVVFLDHGLVRVAEQDKRQVMLVAKPLMAVFILGTYSGHLQPDSLDIVVDIAYRAGFLGTSWRVIGRVEIKDEWSGLQ